MKSPLIAVLSAFLLAATASILAARVIVDTVEDSSVDGVRDALLGEGFTWASVQADGLQVIIEGQAPTEASRFRAMSAAGTVVDAARVIDNMSVVASAGLEAPDFAVEILRNDSGISLIGLIPAVTDRDALGSRVSGIAGDAPISDFLEIADYPQPDTWRDAMNFALRALDQLPQSKISVRADHVTIEALALSAAEKAQLEADLARAVPEGVTLALSINAPRPVITPFTTRAQLQDGVFSFDACAADTNDARAQILAAAIEAGFEGRDTCTIALGAPTAEWGQGVAQGIGALAQLGGGTLTFSDADVSLVALEGTDQALFDQVIGDLTNSLPEAFALAAELPEPPEAQPDGPPQFTATLSPEGSVQLRGRVPDDLINTTAENFAIAQFGADAVTMGTRVTEGLPPGWSLRVLAGLEALGYLSNGAVTVEPDLIRVRGNTGIETASADISRVLIDKLGADAGLEIEVSYVEALDPVIAMPTPEECIARIEVVTEERKILFDPGSATLTAATQQVVDDIAEILRQCLDVRIEIAGYTDSQGREETNLRLSQERADAVLSALRARRVPVSSFTSVGYGEADPIADNDTEEGREANRRIEFRPIVPEEVEEEPTALEENEAEASGE